MPVSLTRSEREDFTIDQIEHSAETKTFSTKELVSGEVLEFPYPLDLDEKFKIPVEQFSLFLFHKDSFAANDIYEIRYSKLRLGWFFPIQALLTDQHDNASNEHFLPYAENAYLKLLANPDNLPYFKLDVESDPSLDKLYGENTYILILFNKYITQFEIVTQKDFDVRNFLIFFYSFGYTYIEDDKTLASIYATTYPSTFKTFQESVVKIKSISNHLVVDRIYINSLFQGLLKFETHQLVKFHLLYSLIELFITKIFEFDFTTNLTLFQNTNDFYDAKEKLAKLTNEKARLNKLFESQCPGIDHALFDLLRVSSNNFLNITDPSKTYNKNAPESIYKVRSSIFHNLRNMPANYNVHLEDVNLNLELVILEIILTLDIK